MWQHRGQKRPSFAAATGPGQESVWDYPRPPELVKDERLAEVFSSLHRLARSNELIRVLETASPPSVYMPPADIAMELLQVVPGTSFCEWKGSATYWGLKADPQAVPIGWSYAEPAGRFAAIAGWMSFYPDRVNCELGGEKVRAQAGGFYGGWITSEIVGPFKGEPGTRAW